MLGVNVQPAAERGATSCMLGSVSKLHYFVADLQTRRFRTLANTLHGFKEEAA